MRMRKGIQLGGTMINFLLVCIFLLAGCGKQSANSLIPDSPYKVIDTGYWNAEVNPLAEPLWLDNERVIFTSTESFTPGKPPYRVKVWNITTGKMVSTDLESVRCVRNGQVVYEKKEPSSDRWVYYRGPLENAKEHPAPGPDMQMDEVFDCDWVPKKTPFDHVPYRSKLLGKNYLEILEKRTKLFEYQKRPVDRKREQETGEDRGPEGKMIYHRDESDPGQNIPSGGISSYSEFLGAYVVGHDYYSPKWPETRSFSILQRNGDLKEVLYPKTTLAGRNDVYPVKPGYLVHYTSGPTTESDPGNRGLYLMQGEKVQRLILGTIGHISISSDGCKAVFIHARSIKESLWLPKPTTTVKLINFCQGGTTP